MDIKSFEKEIKNPDKKYRPVPFWSWNERLNTEETQRQVRLMQGAGMGGFFMHARGGLETEYMGEEWFDNVAAATKLAREVGMYPWAYDENGWPSGFGSGAVNGLGVRYQQKYLRLDESGKGGENTIYKSGSDRFYYDVNPFYVDTLDGAVTDEFIKFAYVPYYERHKNEIEGFFTDEPQISRNGIPWSLILPEEYRREYGEELLPKLSHLFRKEAGYADTRIKFWRLITKLFSKNFMKKIYDFCEERGLKLTGHMVLEETLLSQLTTNGAAMPHYRYFHIPGMDWLGRDIYDCLTARQVASVAAQMGKKQVLSETFALSGHGVSFSELRKIYEWQMVRGINLLCQHLEGYSLRGIRKRDYPPALNYQQPWWCDYEKFNSAMSRIGMLIAEGESDCGVLLLHPETSAWCCFDNGENEGLSELEASFIDTIKVLESKHIQFHLGDEIIMEEEARVEGGEIVIGKMRYATLVLPSARASSQNLHILDSTKRLIEEFSRGGGRVISAEEIEACPSCDNSKISYLKRKFANFNVHYFVNSTDSAQNALIAPSGLKLDIMSGELVPFDKNYTFTPYDSLVVIEGEGVAQAETASFESGAKDTLDLSGEWRIKDSTENALVLDFCDCYFDGELQGENMPVLSVGGAANERRELTDVLCVFRTEIEKLPKKIYLVSETPEIFKFRINGVPFEFLDAGFYCDSSFRRADISSLLVLGENKIELECRFEQSSEVYESIRRASIFESERNKLRYDMEIEALYLVGDFGVKCRGGFEELPKHATRYNGRPVITERAETIELRNIEKQGFPHFAGSITVERSFTISDTSKKILFNMLGISTVKVAVNGSDAGTVLWNFSELDISEHLKLGENTLTLTLTNNLRNLLGPHHLLIGESHQVAPSSFFKEHTFWHWNATAEPWCDGYSLIETSLL